MAVLAGCTVHPKFRQQQEAAEQGRSHEQLQKTAYTGIYDGSSTTSEKLRLGEIIQQYLGTPYQGQSQYRDGMDCSAFTHRVYYEFDHTDLPRTAREQAAAGPKVRSSDLQYGDLVFFKTDGRSISHVGIYVGFDEFVHSSTSQGVIISDLNDKYWKRRLVGAVRIIK